MPTPSSTSPPAPPLDVLPPHGLFSCPDDPLSFAPPHPPLDSPAPVLEVRLNAGPSVRLDALALSSLPPHEAPDSNTNDAPDAALDAMPSRLAVLSNVELFGRLAVNRPRAPAGRPATYGLLPPTHAPLPADAATDSFDLTLRSRADILDSPGFAALDMDHLEEDEPHSMRSDYPSSRVIAISPSSYLRAGSQFHGAQKSERQVHEVLVHIKHVDLRDSFLCGFLRINGLTEHHPTLTTYFEGEIIGSKHGFITKHPSWGATEKIDLSHWSRFNAFRPLQKNARRGQVLIPDFSQREHIFMRWKESFLVPDHTIRTIVGASFEGFYYICFNQINGEIDGIYFHSNSEKFQRLHLKHVKDRGCFSAMEFR